MIAPVPPSAPLAPGRFALGVNLSGLEIDQSLTPGVAGTDYVAPSASELAAYHAQGLNLVRLPIAWEQLQPVLGGPLDPAYLAQVQGTVSAAAALGMGVILDVHDGGGYGTHKLGDGTLTDAQFADLWRRLSTAFAGQAGIAGYDLMNEPNHMPSATAWQDAAQAAITAIRGTGDTTTIYVEGNTYSGAGTWTASNAGLQNLVDPTGRLIFSAHVYLDRDNSGTHDSWQQEVANGVTTQTGAQRLSDFVGWLQRYGLKGAVGEVGAANNDPNWLAALDATLAYARQNGLQTTYWAGGPWWGDYALSVEPGSNGQAAPQMAVLDRYTGAVPTLHVAAPALAGTATPDTVITASEGSKVLGTTTSDAGGAWTLSITGLTNGQHTVTVAQAGTGAIGALSFDLEPAAATSAAVALAGPHAEYVVTGQGNAVQLADRVAGHDGTRSAVTNTVVQFADGVGLLDASGDVERVAHLYRAAFGRTPDLDGVRYWSGLVGAGTVTMLDVANAFAGSGEFTASYGATTDAQFVAQVYGNVLGRVPDAAGLQYWQDQLAAGSSRAAVLLGFSGSYENVRNTLATTGDANQGEAYRLYQAAFARTPDDAGLSYWTGALQAGTTPRQVADSFLASPEFGATYGALGDTDFVQALYHNVLGRAADAAGAQYWTGQIGAGLSRAGVLLGFSDSAENRVATATATHANWVFLPNATA